MLDLGAMDVGSGIWADLGHKLVQPPEPVLAGEMAAVAVAEVV